MEVELVAREIIDGMRSDLSEKWDEIDEEYKEGMRKTAKFTAKMMARELAGEDVSREMIHLDAQLKNWQFMHASMAQRAFWDSVQKAAEIVGSVFVSVAKKAILGL